MVEERRRKHGEMRKSAKLELEDGSLGKGMKGKIPFKPAFSAAC
jgi:hypothetical protein